MSNLEQLNTIKANTLAQMAEVSAETKAQLQRRRPDRSAGPQYLEHLQRPRRLVQPAAGGRRAFEFPTQGYTP